MPHITNLFINSGDASEINANKSKIHLYLNTPLILPKTEDVYCKCLASTIWYDHPNVITGTSDTMTFNIDGNAYVFVVEQGLYSVKLLQSRISELCVNATPPLLSDTITITSDDATGKISLRVNYAVSMTWNFGVGNTLFALLGFTGTNTTPTGEWRESNNVAQLNNIAHYNIHCSFINGGYYSKNAGSNIVQQVYISKGDTPGSQIVSKDPHPTTSRVHEHYIDTIIIYLTSDINTEIITQENFTLHLELYT